MYMKVFEGGEEFGAGCEAPYCGKSEMDREGEKPRSWIYIPDPKVFDRNHVLESRCHPDIRTSTAAT